MAFGGGLQVKNVSILLLMEMVLEYSIAEIHFGKHCSFNPSSNGNGAGIKGGVNVVTISLSSFNPSSNGNGAGIYSFLDSKGSIN